MKKVLQGMLLFSFVLLIACKKDKTPVYDLTLTINGTAVLLHQATAYLGPDTLNAGHTELYLTAATYDSSKALTISIRKNDLTLSTGAYTSPGTGYTLLVEYYENIPGNIKNYSIANAPGKGTSQYTVNLTEVTASYIRGNFTGNYLTDTFSASNTTAEVPQGEFFALRVY